MKPITFALRHPFQVLAVLFPVLLGCVIASSGQQVGSPDLTVQESRIDLAGSSNIQQSALSASSHQEQEIARFPARSALPARLIRRREKAGAVRLAFHSLAQTGTLPFLTTLPNLFALTGHSPFVCQGMAAASWGLPGVLLSHNDHATS